MYIPKVLARNNIQFNYSLTGKSGQQTNTVVTLLAKRIASVCQQLTNVAIMRLFHYFILQFMVLDLIKNCMIVDFEMCSKYC